MWKGNPIQLDDNIAVRFGREQSVLMKTFATFGPRGAIRIVVGLSCVWLLGLTAVAWLTPENSQDHNLIFTSTLPVERVSAHHG